MDARRRLKFAAYEVSSMPARGEVFMEMQCAKSGASAGSSMTPDECERLICNLARALAEVAPERVKTAFDVHVYRHHGGFELAAGCPPYTQSSTIAGIVAATALALLLEVPDGE